MEHLPVREDIWAIMVDPLEEFLREEGRFYEIYGEDAQSILDIEPRLHAFVSHFQGKVRNVLVRSEYAPDQFRRHGVTNLCVPGSPKRNSVIDQSLFEREHNKSDNSLFSCPRMADTHKSAPKVMIVGGVTLTSCVQLTVNNLLDATRERKVLENGNVYYPVPESWDNTKIIVVKNSVAYRASQQDKAETIFEELSRNDRVYVVETPKQAHELALQIAA